jgi:aryl-alcohol dehydrogenase-like predicted oxidoreductase
MSVERSLQRLETDFIDLVLVHSDGNDLAILNDCEVYETLRTQRRARFAASASPAKPSTAA